MPALSDSLCSNQMRKGAAASLLRAGVNELHDPVHLCLQQSVDILHMTAGQLRGDDPQREQRQSEMLIRYVINYFHCGCSSCICRDGILKVVQQQQASSEVGTA